MVGGNLGSLLLLEINLLLATNLGLKGLESATEELLLLLLVSTAPVKTTLCIAEFYGCLWLSHHLSSLLHAAIEGSLLVGRPRVAGRVLWPILLHLDWLYLGVHGVLIQLRCLRHIQTLLVVADGSHGRLHLVPSGAIVGERGHLGLKMAIPGLLQVHTQVVTVYVALVDFALVGWVAHEQRCGIWSLVLDAAITTWF